MTKQQVIQEAELRDEEAEEKEADWAEKHCCPNAEGEWEC